MEIVRLVHSMKEISRRERAGGAKIGFVPTMGYLHEGHLSLIRRIKEISDIVVVSVFVNPTQFGPNEDFANYPRDLPRDTDLCIAEGVDYLFVPEADELFPPESCTWVDVGKLSETLEGASRPGHFRGVATVVLKLFEIVRPTVAAFGQKDAQQALVIQRMTRDLMVDTEILVLPIVRDEDGVALSSRLRYLSTAERKAVRAIPRALDEAKRVVREDKADPAAVVGAARRILESEPLLEIEYVELVGAGTLEPVTALKGELLLAIAARAGKTRLIDNAMLKAPASAKASS